MKKGLDKKLGFGKYKDLTPRQIIENGHLDYILFLDKKEIVMFTPETYRYIDNLKK